MRATGGVVSAGWPGAPNPGMVQYECSEPGEKNKAMRMYILGWTGSNV